MYFVFLMMLFTEGDLQVFTGPASPRRAVCMFVYPMEQSEGRVLLEGKLLRKGEVVERLKRHLRPNNGEVRFALELVSGSYTLQAKLTNRHKELLGKVDHTFEVTTKSFQPHPDLPTTRLTIKPPSGAADELLTGKQKFEAKITGAAPVKVIWYLDGKKAGQNTKAPFAAKLKLGSAPLMRQVWALALNADNQIIASDLYELNVGPYAFSVKVAEPHRDMPVHGQFRVSANLRIPKDKELERLDFFSSNRKIASVYDEPYHCFLPAPEDGLPFEIRLVAHLMDGAVSETRVTLNDRNNIAGLEVWNVDLWVTVENKQGLPVTGFKRSHFSIFEDGKPMRTRKFEHASTQPLALHFLMDTSGSMEKFMDQIIFGCRSIIDAHVRPSDRVGLIAFRDEPDMVEPFTTDQDALMEGLTDIAEKARDRTYHGSAIYDSMATSLHHFSGVQGRRAMVIFTDGLDNRSRFRKGEVLDQARQAGVRLYLFDVEPGAESYPLAALAKESGGAYYKVNAESRLPALFELLAADLRMQYLLSYQSAREPGDRACRQVDVKMSTTEFVARTMKGYCP